VQKLLSIIAVSAVVLALGTPVRAQGRGERVTFSSLDRSFGGKLTASLSEPAGAGPFPAMVLLHTCSGLQPFVYDWGTWFVKQGYAALVVDSFGPRGVRTVCGGGAPTVRTRAFDALGALAYLRTRSEIDSARIGVIGWSHGAGAAYSADDSETVKRSGLSKGFAASVALYPPCDSRTSADAIAAPLLFLLGADDDWTPASACQVDVDRLSQAAVPVVVHTYPGATHAFDNPSDRGVIHVGIRTYTLNYDAGAARDAHDRVRAFLAAQMK
jgi:dienelactone hydrolase